MDWTLFGLCACGEASCPKSIVREFCSGSCHPGASDSDDEEAGGAPGRTGKRRPSKRAGITAEQILAVIEGGNSQAVCFHKYLSLVRVATAPVQAWVAVMQSMS